MNLVGQMLHTVFFAVLFIDARLIAARNHTQAAPLTADLQLALDWQAGKVIMDYIDRGWITVRWIIGF